MSFYSREELLGLGLRAVGSNVSVSRKASIYGLSRISIGDNSRIDDFCVISAGEGGIEIGHHVHVAAMCTLIGAATIRLGDYAGLSGRVSIYSSSDDYGGEFMTNPTVPAEFTRVISAPVTVGRHAIVGAGAIVLPGVEIGEGVAVGALSLVTKSLERDTVYSGVPARRLGARKTGLYELEKKLDERPR